MIAAKFQPGAFSRGDRALVVRYYAVSAACLALNNAILIAADALGAPLALSAPAVFVVSACASYLLHAAFTFRQPLSLPVGAAYGGSMLAGFALWIALIAAMTARLGLAMAIAAPLASAVMVLVNFLLARAAFAVGARKSRSR